MGSIEITSCVDADDVAEVAARDTLELIARLQQERPAPTPVSVVLTGGGVGIDVLNKIRASDRLLSVDWGRVELWWSDERHVAPDDPERNERMAREALLDHVELEPTLVHAWPWAPEMSAEVAAAAMNEDLAARPPFDLVLVGLGPDRHVGSLFPGYDVQRDDPRLALSVENAPKPPPERVTMTLPCMNRSPELWFVTAGESKAEPVRDAIEGTDVVAIPACGARGNVRTRFIIDTAAAALVAAPSNEEHSA